MAGKVPCITSDSLKFKIVEPSGEIEASFELDGHDLQQDTRLFASEVCEGHFTI